MFSDDIGGRLKALASTKLKIETANRQSSSNHARDRLDIQATACYDLIFVFKTMPSEREVSEGIGMEARTTRAYCTHSTHEI